MSSDSGTTATCCATISGPRPATSGSIDELAARDKANLDITWLRDESIEDSASLPDPDVLAREIMEELKAALEQFSGIVEDLGGE